ncbi:MAG: DNA methyltransferase [Chloroflexi bacterium]|nr:DNA methyltransferase [Chloroflexota bacterium]
MSFWTTDSAGPQPEDWTFSNAPTREITHCYHDYPARMIPQVAGKLLEMFSSGAQLLFDPYCGTGTSLVEGTIRGLEVAGTDLNPLARLIARAKTALPAERELNCRLLEFEELVSKERCGTEAALPVGLQIPGITDVDFWFKRSVSARLLRLKEFIDGIGDEAARLFFQVAFSETTRESSNTRSSEFKLYRYHKEKLKTFDPDVFGIMQAKLRRNVAGLRQYRAALSRINHHPVATVYDFNTVEGIPGGTLLPGSVDLVITSPPYGDSHTTVAYGQYSRLSAAWLGLPDPQKVDRRLMGGTLYKAVDELPSPALSTAISQIATVDPKRAREVQAFYVDLYRSISHVAPLIRPGGYTCYVVGNRKVKGVVLPTDIAVRNFFEEFGFQYVATFIRSIPNKRMPLRNSPTNAPGVVDHTMLNEYIVVLRRALRPLTTSRASAEVGA